uniref:Uncharacterized protein n=1 Tax=Ditylenchus dipsaci TaxID=166011 RepID=A0A915DK96_9BILA
MVALVYKTILTILIAACLVNCMKKWLKSKSGYKSLKNEGESSSTNDAVGNLADKVKVIITYPRDNKDVATSEQHVETIDAEVPDIITKKEFRSYIQTNYGITTTDQDVIQIVNKREMKYFVESGHETLVGGNTSDKYALDQEQSLQEVYRTIANVDELIGRIKIAFIELPQEMINNCIAAYPLRLNRCIADGGRSVEETFANV